MDNVKFYRAVLALMQTTGMTVTQAHKLVSENPVYGVNIPTAQETVAYVLGWRDGSKVRK